MHQHFSEKDLQFSLCCVCCVCVLSLSSLETRSYSYSGQKCPRSTRHWPGLAEWSRDRQPQGVCLCAPLVLLGEGPFGFIKHTWKLVFTFWGQGRRRRFPRLPAAKPQREAGRGRSSEPEGSWPRGLAVQE